MWVARCTAVPSRRCGGREPLADPGTAGQPGMAVTNGEEREGVCCELHSCALLTRLETEVAH